MTIADIIRHRLINQQIEEQRFSSAKEVVSWLGAIQAQDYQMAKWAIGIRLPKATDVLIEKAIDSAEIIRTHILRPTWHFVATEDVRWMIELSAPQIGKTLNVYSERLELTAKVCSKSNELFAKLLSGGKHMTREELMGELKRNKIITANSIQSLQIMMKAEISGIVCNGPKKGKQFTYALLDERVPKSKKLDREEAIAKLAQRYFTSHGPATVHDFGWWSGLKMTEAKLGVELNRKNFDSATINNQTFWFRDSGLVKKNKTEEVHFLPAFDEYVISYTDRSLSMEIDIMKKAITSNAIFKPVCVINGKVEGIWNRTIKKDKTIVETHFLKLKKVNKKLLESALQSYSQFLGHKVVLST